MRDNQEWWLVLVIWGEKYSDDDCNRLIFSALRHSTNCKGVCVLTDRLDRAIDSRATLVPFPEDFNRDDFKRSGLPIKICMFDLPTVPEGDVCIYVDLDSMIVGNLDKIAVLAEKADIWTIDVFPRRFSRFRRARFRLSGGKYFTAGNSSCFVFKNRFPGNPTEKFRTLFAAGKLPKRLLHDDRFIGWSCQEKLRGFPTHLVSYFRLEFLAPAMWITRLFAIFRKRLRQQIVVVTFAGRNTKLEKLLAAGKDERIVDHHGRVGYWTNDLTSGISGKIEAELQAFKDR
ncbi:hypothetical protein SAMN05421665_2195 [Yoonia rosea]|uniref:Glycosyl transferase family 8 n=1 Tax=Yoonia rosea TaxID=287098 RepID=A0A1R3X5R6_9RHOB|nr:hypothetical protein [Yoonia rosea]SIT86001.1 hypothetical protein SAMN05421665_2195 [Yoonia rosea]